MSEINAREDLAEFCEVIFPGGLRYQVSGDEGSPFLNGRGCSNDAIFSRYSIDKERLSHEIVGYYLSGMFPYFSTSKDLLKFISAIGKKLAEAGERGPIQINGKRLYCAQSAVIRRPHKISL